MKTARDRAEFWLAMNVAGYDEKQVDCLEVLLKEQDNLTRHACSDAMAYIHKVHISSRPTLIGFDAAQGACINVKAV